MSGGGGEYVLLNKRISGRFTVPSGIVTVTLDTVRLLAEEIPELGVITTKSIGPVERAGNREPVFCQLEGRGEGAWANAVGLANPGCDLFAEELAELQLPPNKFLLVSIFGGTTEDFQRVASKLAPFADALELNFSCPHAEGYGQAICATPALAAQIVEAVRKVTDKPLLPKLSPNLTEQQLDELVVSLIKAGAAGFSAINTVGPVDNPCATAGGINVLSKGKGGSSGPLVLEKGLDVVKQLAAVLHREGAHDLPIIGMGGIATSTDVRQFEEAGAAIFGVGSALTGLSTADMKLFFARLNEQVLACGAEMPVSPAPLRAALPADYMEFRKFTLRSVELANPELGVFRFDEPLPCAPGRFVEVWVPGEGEKPFAQACEEPLTLAVRAVGQLTGHFFTLKPGDAVYVRGPYGKGFSVPAPIGSGAAAAAATADDGDVVYVMVGGGTGIAPLLLLAEKLSKETRVPAERLRVYLGGRGKEHIYFAEEFAAYGRVGVSTDDGSQGFHGFVTQLMKDELDADAAAGKHVRYHFFNCGPEVMMRVAKNIQRAYPRVDIECSVERYMKCGVGICGVCACDGLRMCVDGPVMHEQWLESSAMFGKKHRAKTTKLLDW